MAEYLTLPRRTIPSQQHDLRCCDESHTYVAEIRLTIANGGGSRRESRIMARSNSVIATDVNVAERKVTFKVGDRPAMVLDLARVHEANIAYAALHGFKQRVSDAGALERTDDNGRLIPADELISAKFQRMSALIEHYHSGTDQWSTRREGSQSEGGLLLQSLIRAGADPETAKAQIAKWSRSEQLAVLGSAKVKPHADAIRAEQGRGIDSEALLAGIL